MTTFPTATSWWSAGTTLRSGSLLCTPRTFPFDHTLESKVLRKDIKVVVLIQRGATKSNFQMENPHHSPPMGLWIFINVKQMIKFWVLKPWKILHSSQIIHFCPNFLRKRRFPFHISSCPKWKTKIKNAKSLNLQIYLGTISLLLVAL